MTELNTFLCDRCKTEFTTPVHERPARIRTEDPYESEGFETLHYCYDCWASFIYFTGEHWEKFDKLVTKCLNIDMKEDQKVP